VAVLGCFSGLAEHVYVWFRQSLNARHFLNERYLYLKCWRLPKAWPDTAFLEFKDDVRTSGTWYKHIRTKILRFQPTSWQHMAFRENVHCTYSARQPEWAGQHHGNTWTSWRMYSLPATTCQPASKWACEHQGSSLPLGSVLSTCMHTPASQQKLVGEQVNIMAVISLICHQEECTVLSSLLPASQPVGEQVNVMAALGHQGKCTLCLHKKTNLKIANSETTPLLFI